MANQKPKLELTWIGKEQRPKLEPRILVEDPARSFHAPFRAGESDVLKWFKPPKGVFRIPCPGGESYEPDFVVETGADKYVCEVKDASELQDPQVRAKAAAAAAWCALATEHERAHGGKPWTYLLIPDDTIADNKTLKGMAAAPRV